MNIIEPSKTNFESMVRVKYIKLLSAIIFILFLSNVVNADNRYWVSAGGTAWADNNNWSASSGGPIGASFPILGDVAYFDIHVFRQ